MTVHEQLVKASMGQCVHFNGIQNDACKAGVKYEPFYVNGAVMNHGKNLLPCFADNVGEKGCDSALFRSEDEAEADALDTEEMFRRHALGHSAAKDDAKARGLKRGNGGRGSVKCPTCESGTIRYSVAGMNGHMHAACSTPKCVRWME